MGFNARIKKSTAQGALAAFAAPWAAFKGSVIPLNTITAGNVASTAGLVISLAQSDIEWSSIGANIQAVQVTASIVSTFTWQVSNDGTNWTNLLGFNGAANVGASVAGAGTSTWNQVLAGVNCPWPYLRAAVTVSGATGAAGDNVTVSYNFRNRWNM